MNKKIHIITDWMCSLGFIATGFYLLPNILAFLLLVCLGVVLNPLFRNFAHKE